MYFIGSTDCKGTYFFYSKQHKGWIVADLDHQKATLHNKLATVLMPDTDSDSFDYLEKHRCTLGQDGPRFLVDGENHLLLLLKKFKDEVEILLVFNEDGTERPYGTKEKELAEFLGKAQEKFKECE